MGLTISDLQTQGEGGLKYTPLGLRVPLPYSFPTENLDPKSVF